MGEERDKVEIPEILDLRSKMSGWKEPQPGNQHSPTSTATGWGPGSQSGSPTEGSQRLDHLVNPSHLSVSLCSRRHTERDTEEEHYIALEGRGQDLGPSSWRGRQASCSLCSSCRPGDRVLPFHSLLPWPTAPSGTPGAVGAQEALAGAFLCLPLLGPGPLSLGALARGLHPIPQASLGSPTPTLTGTRLG